MDVVPDIEDDQINLSFDFYVNEDFESGKSQSQKNFTDVQTADPLKRNFHNDKDSITGGNITLELNEEVEICNPMLSWVEDIVEIRTGKDIQDNGNEVASKVMKYANKYKSEGDVGNKQIFSDGGDLVKNSTGKAIREFNYDPLELEAIREVFKFDNGDKSNDDEDNEHTFSWGEDLVENRTRKRIRELDSDPLEFEAASKLSKYDNGDKSKVDDGGEQPLEFEATTKLSKYENGDKSKVDDGDEQIFSGGGDLAKITTGNGIKDLGNDYISVLDDKDIDIKENYKPIENLNNENFSPESSHLNSTPKKIKFSIVNSSPQSNLSSPEEGPVPSIVETVAVSVQDDNDIVENIEDTEEPQSEPDLILYSPRTSSDTEQDKEIIDHKESFMNNYIFDLFGAED